MLAVHFGAGNIGRGFIGNLLYQAGYETCFIDVNEELVNAINKDKQYRVVLADSSQQEMLVKNVSAINSKLNPENVITAIAKADLVTTAVGPHILPFIVELLAAGLRKRIALSGEPLNIIACENMIGGTSWLKESMYKNLSAEEQTQFDGLFGFPDSAVDRIVPNQIHDDKLTVKVEPFYEWIVDETKIMGKTPKINGVTYVSDLVPYIERKLFTVNTGHALAAYIGYLFGIDTINKAMEDQQVFKWVEDAIKETGEMLVHKFDFTPVEHEKYIQKIMLRFQNPFIIDEVTRVARSPIRKLKENDRLVGPASQYLDILKKKPVNLLRGIASALLYDFPDDEEAVQLQSDIREQGIEKTIEKYTSLSPSSILFQGILEQYHRLKVEKV
jgi:mannitol-1-phosphate 5-dehydrogenase